MCLLSWWINPVKNGYWILDFKTIDYNNSKNADKVDLTDPMMPTRPRNNDISKEEDHEIHKYVFFFFFL